MFQDGSTSTLGVSSMAVYTSRRLFIVTAFEQMSQTGIFREDG
jgi:hypothetical protein